MAQQGLMGGNDIVCETFVKMMTQKLWRVDALLVTNAVLAAVMVGIGHRYRHRPFSGFLYDGATSLFLPIMSYVVSEVSYTYVIGVKVDKKSLTAECYGYGYTNITLMWTALVQIVGINTSAVVAVDEREGRNIGPPVVFFVQAVWTVYLAVYNISAVVQETTALLLLLETSLFLSLPFVFIFVKMIINLCAFFMVRRSFALGRNPRLIVSYMEQLETGIDGDQHEPPPLLLWGEETMQVEKQPRGYSFNWRPDSDQGDATGTNRKGLVTMDKVWQSNDILLGPTAQLKDLCLSFALFKLLRCRFARYTIAEAGFHKVSNFIWHVLLMDGNDEERVLRMIADELSFLHDFYYSSLSISYPNRRLPILSIFISLSSIAYCLFALLLLVLGFILVHTSGGHVPIHQVMCETKDCNDNSHNFGNILFGLVPVSLLAALVVLTEARKIVSYISCNWTKVALVCRFVNRASWAQKCVGFLLRRRCNLLKHWQDKMNQCSILVLHAAKTPMALLRCLIPGLPDQKKNVKVPRAVKAVVIDTLRGSEESRSNGVITLRRSLQVGGNILWEFNGKGMADTMLACHIATSILEVRHPASASDHKVAATHLSRYCAYLVAYSPELLPDDDAWCKSLYKGVKKDAIRVVAGRAATPTPEAESRQLVNLLSAEPNHEVLKNGARLGKKLAELAQGEEEKAWEVLAGFWSEMLLYVAPSDNLDGHAEAIARGGELITLLWALLAHVGIVSRADTTGAATAGAPVAV